MDAVAGERPGRPASDAFQRDGQAATTNRTRLTNGHHTLPLDIEGYGATLQHLGSLARKIAVLEAARAEAEMQHLHRIGAAYAAGLIDFDDLADAYIEFRAVAGTGFSQRWNAAIPEHAQRLLAYARSRPDRLPNGEHGSWQGAFPFDGGPTPANGSTERLRYRLRRHASDGKRFVFWRAHPCANREDAYALEDRLLKQHKPYLNKKAAA